MSRGSLHNRIIDQLSTYLKQWNYEKVYSGHGKKQSRHPTPIAHPIGGKTITIPQEYFPDCWTQHHRNVEVYEVWGKGETVTAAIEDIVLSALTIGIRYITVICTEEADGITVDEANKLCKLILHFMKDVNGKNLVPLGYWKVLKIPQNVWNDDKKIYQTFAKSRWMQDY